MRLRFVTLLIGLSTLVQGVLLVAQPAGAAAVVPVRLDPSCAGSLTARLAGDLSVRILGCDPTGPGRAVVALGDPATAADVVLLVPGADIDLTTLDDPVVPDRRPMGWARALSAAAGPDTAVVLWVGYPTPQGLGRDAATGRLARAAVPALVEEVTALRDRPGGVPHLTVLGHSYGAVVVALAAPQLAADDLVLLASPGARAPDVTALHTSARVWAGSGPGDWIGRVPHLQLGDLGHGADPAAASFGARPLDVADVTAHDGYFRAGSASLTAIADVVTGVRP
ncbi:alpha/beta hydrolase [Modestobacter altitudinis]|uniref:alpha/beta hydrolase n=1 Tax=Modestobacter altitudinis TaxID=2213158 RepID=UPI00110CBAAD|nr:alpha/beta hydrolase [Modestobacter altitudinis]